MTVCKGFEKGGAIVENGVALALLQNRIAYVFAEDDSVTTYDQLDQNRFHVDQTMHLPSMRGVSGMQ